MPTASLSAGRRSFENVRDDENLPRSRMTPRASCIADLPQTVTPSDKEGHREPKKDDPSPSSVATPNEVNRAKASAG